MRAALCRRDLYQFLLYFWDTYSQDAYTPNWHIPYLCKRLTAVALQVAEGKPNEGDLIINIPPGSTKSGCASVMFPVWCWTRWPWMNFVTGSHNEKLALDLAVKSRNVIYSKKFQTLFPELEIKPDESLKSDYRIQRWTEDEDGVPVAIPGGHRYTTTVGSSGITGYHGHIQIIDDPINPRKAVSPEQIRTANDWMDQTLSTRKSNVLTTAMILIMQRLHENDPAGHVMHRKGSSLICLPGEIRHYQEQVSPPELIEEYVDDLLDPVRRPWPALERMEQELGQYGFAGQIGQNPTPPGGGMFKVDRFVTVDSVYESDIVARVRYWDNGSTQGGGDPTAGVKMYKLRDGKYLIADVKHGQWDTDEREKIKRATAEADGLKTAVHIEREGGSGGKDTIQWQIKNLDGFRVYEDRVSVRGSKPERADAYSVAVNNGNVLLLRGEWNHAFKEEHRFFPFGTHDDQVDAAAGAHHKLSEKRRIQDLTR